MWRVEGTNRTLHMILCRRRVTVPYDSSVNGQQARTLRQPPRRDRRDTTHDARVASPNSPLPSSPGWLAARPVQDRRRKATRVVASWTTKAVAVLLQAATSRLQKKRLGTRIFKAPSKLARAPHGQFQQRIQDFSCHLASCDTPPITSPGSGCNLVRNSITSNIKIEPRIQF